MSSCWVCEGEGCRHCTDPAQERHEALVRRLEAAEARAAELEKALKGLVDGGNADELGCCRFCRADYDTGQEHHESCEWLVALRLLTPPTEPSQGEEP